MWKMWMTRWTNRCVISVDMLARTRKYCFHIFHAMEVLAVKTVACLVCCSIWDSILIFVSEAMLMQGLAEYFSVCGEVTAVRLAGTLGNKKAWIEFGTKESAKSAKEYDNTVSNFPNEHHLEE